MQHFKVTYKRGHIYNMISAEPIIHKTVNRTGARGIKWVRNSRGENVSGDTNNLLARGHQRTL